MSRRSKTSACRAGLHHRTTQTPRRWGKILLRRGKLPVCSGSVTYKSGFRTPISGPETPIFGQNNRKFEIRLPQPNGTRPQRRIKIPHRILPGRVFWNLKAGQLLIRQFECFCGTTWSKNVSRTFFISNYPLDTKFLEFILSLVERLRCRNFTRGDGNKQTAYSY